MTRDERIGRGVAAYDAADHRKINPVEAALDAALADLGGLDGLAEAAHVHRYAALRADRDRLREALMFAARGDDSNSTASKAWLAARLRSVAERAREALRDSEAGTKC